MKAPLNITSQPSPSCCSSSSPPSSSPKSKPQHQRPGETEPEQKVEQKQKQKLGGGSSKKALLHQITRARNMLTTLVLCATLLFLSTPFSIAQAKTALFVFGDSLYDDGMTLYNGVKGAGAEFWPYGETYFKKPAGRYSDGRLIPDFIAQFAGLEFLPPYLLPGLKDYSNGVNFASAGACVLVETRPSTINLKRQVDYFVQMVQKFKQQKGEAEANKVLSSAVYLFNIGGNDYVSLLEKKLNKPIAQNAKKLYMNKVVGNFTNHIRTIYNQGARKFAFQNIGPLGCMPSMKYMLGFNGTCAKVPQELARMHNAAFLASLKKLQSELPGFKYSIYDFYASLSFRVLYGVRYGFSESQIACCGSGAYHGDFTCQKKGENFSVCSNPNDYLWFDAAHPTDKANQQFSKEFWSGGSNLVSPMNLQSLFRA